MGAPDSKLIENVLQGLVIWGIYTACRLHFEGLAIWIVYITKHCSPLCIYGLIVILVVLGFHTRSCMVDLQRKTECVSWADEPSPYSSPIPFQPPLLRPSSPLFHRLVPFCQWSGWGPHTTRGSLTCTMHMSTSPSSWWRVGQASTLERGKRLITSGVKIFLHELHSIHTP